MSSISLQLPRLCIWTAEAADDRVLSGVGPNLEQYRMLKTGEYRLASRTNVFGCCAEPITVVRRIVDTDAFVIVGALSLCILRDSELTESSIPFSRVHPFSDEILTIAYAVKKEEMYEFGLVFRSGRTQRVTASIDGANRLRVDTVAEYDGTTCGLLTSALCLLPAGSAAPWEEMHCIAGSAAQGEIRLWGTREGTSSTSTTECGNIGSVISMTAVEQCDASASATVLAVTENRSINLWRIRYRDHGWLHVEEAAHAARPSALAYCSSSRRAVSAAEDGELCLWLVSETAITLLRRFQTRAGAVRSLRIDGGGRIVIGSETGALLSLPMSSLTAEPEIHFIEGPKLTMIPHSGVRDRKPIRSFAVVHHHEKYDKSIAPGKRRTELRCLGEDGSTFKVVGDHASEESDGSYSRLTSWTDKDSAITVFHSATQLRMSSYHPPDHLAADSCGYTVLSERISRSTILTARPTMSRRGGRSTVVDRSSGSTVAAGGAGAEPYVVVQATSGVIALIRHCFAVVRIWRYRIPREEGEVEGKMMVVNTVAIDRSCGSTALHVVLGTTNGRLLYAPMRGDGEQVPEGDNALDFALDERRHCETLKLYPRSRRLESTSITQLEYCSERRQCTALSENGWIMRMRVEEGRGLVVSSEESTRQCGVEWPVRIERRGGEEYVIGFNPDSAVPAFATDYDLPMHVYEPLLEIIQDAVTDRAPFNVSLVTLIEQISQSDLSLVARPLVNIFAFSHTIRPLLCKLFEYEIAKCTRDMNTLFRSQSLAIKMMNELMRVYGSNYLVKTIKPVLDMICADRLCCEVDPCKLQADDHLETNQSNLVAYFMAFFDRVVASADACPLQLREIFADLRNVVRRTTGKHEVEMLALSSFLVMRFFGPAILNPTSFGVKQDHTEQDPRVSRTLVLLSKMLQRLANCIVSTHPLISKESWLVPVMLRVTSYENKRAMCAYLEAISTSESEQTDGATMERSLHDVTVASEGHAVVKEGTLVHHAPMGEKFALMLRRIIGGSKKKRYVVLTEAEVGWKKAKGDATLRERIPLSELSTIDRTTVSSFRLRSERGAEMIFDAAAKEDSTEWMDCILQQRDRALAPVRRHDTTVRKLDIDMVRELEAVYKLLLDKASTLAAWKRCLEAGTNTVPAGTQPLPKDMPQDAASRAAFASILRHVLECTYDIEEAHRTEIARYQRVNSKRKLVVVSRSRKTCLLSIDFEGGDRQVHVDLKGGDEEYGSGETGGYGSQQGGGVERITVYYGKDRGIVRHTQRSLTAGLRELAGVHHPQ